MKRTLLSLIIVTAILGIAVLVNPARGDSDDAKPAVKKDEAKKEADEPRISRDTNGNVVVKLDAETQKIAALKSATVEAAQLAPELKAYGRVLDPAPLAGLMMEIASDRAASSASSNELARLKTLSTSGNASERAIQTAEANAVHDQLTLQSAQDRLLLSWGKEISERPELHDFLQSLAKLDAVLIRLDLPAGQHLDPPPAEARIATLTGNTITAKLVGAALAVDPQTQGQGFIFEAQQSQSRLLPGESVTGYLKTPGEPLAGVLVPSDAVVRTEGKGWAYVATDDDHFTRKEIALDRSTEKGWFVTNGVSAGDKIIVAGAQSLLSEETKTALQPD